MNIKNKNKIIVIILALTVIMFSVMVVDFYYGKKRTVNAASLAWGSQGNKVSEVQRKLKQWGYFDGPVTGYYGQQTYDAVKYFQRNNGLNADGVIGTSTANALGITLNGGTASSGGGGGAGGANATNTGTTNVATPSRGSNDSDVYLLARAIHGEARGEPYVGKVAIAAVILNRVKDANFPNTIAGVIYQPRAFTAVDDGQINLTPDEESLRAARDALNGWDPTYGAIYYYNSSTATSSWIWSRPVHLTIGKHNFAT